MATVTVLRVEPEKIEITYHDLGGCYESFDYISTFNWKGWNGDGTC